jgi:hypothetical protein
MKRENITPTDVLKTFIISLHSGDIETIKSTLSGCSIPLIENISASQNITFAEALEPLVSHIPKSFTDPHRELIDGCRACIEVNKTGTNNLDWLVFAKEMGMWRLALHYKIEAVKEEKNIREKIFAYLQNIFRKLFKKSKDEVIRTKGKIYRS